MKPLSIVSWVSAALVVASVLVGVWTGKDMLETQTRITAYQQYRESKTRLLVALLDAETGQRGFILTGRDLYLSPYFAALTVVPTELRVLKNLLVTDDQSVFFNTLSPVITAKLDELHRTVDLYRVQGRDAAMGVVLTESGRLDLETIRALFQNDDMRSRNALDRLNRHQNEVTQITLYALLLLFGGSMGFVGTVNRDHRVRSNQLV